MHHAVDLGRVAFAAAGAAARRDRIDQYLLPGADFSGEAARRDRLLARHEPVIALLLDRLGDRRSEIVGDRATHRLVTEASDAVERSSVEPVEQEGKVLLGLAR